MELFKKYSTFDETITTTAGTGTAMVDMRPFRIGKRRKVAVLYQDGREFVVCHGKDAQEKAALICEALNRYVQASPIQIYSPIWQPVV